MIYSGPTELSDGVVRLREITPADAPLLYELRMDPGSRLMFRTTATVPYVEHFRLVERYFQADNDDRWFVVEDAAGPVGAHALYGLAPDGSAECGRLLIAPAARGRGYARRSLRLLIDHARALGLRELRAVVLAENAASLRVHRAEGFIDAGEEHETGRRFILLSIALNRR